MLINVLLITAIYSGQHLWCTKVHSKPEFNEVEALECEIVTEEKFVESDLSCGSTNLTHFRFHVVTSDKVITQDAPEYKYAACNYEWPCKPCRLLPCRGSSRATLKAKRLQLSWENHGCALQFTANSLVIRGPFWDPAWEASSRQDESLFCSVFSPP